MSKIVGYEAVGDVRGACRHLHKTPEAAEKCRKRDMRSCQDIPGGNGYSDRRVYPVYDDGSYGPEMRAEWDGPDIVGWI